MMDPETTPPSPLAVPARVIAELAANDHGAFRFDESGLTHAQLRTCIAQGWVERVLPGVGVVAASPATDLRSLAAALLWAGPSAMAAGRTSAARWGVATTSATKPELWMPTDRRHASITRIGSEVDRRTTRRRRDGFWVSSPEWTLRDLLRTESAEAIEVAFEHLRQRRWLTLERMAEHLDEHRVRNERRIGELRTIVAELRGTQPCESALEVRVARLLRAHRFERPDRQMRVGAHRFDFVWPWRFVALECMGAAFHHDAAAWKRDLERLTTLGAATGYTILFATWDDTKRPDLLIARLREAFATRAA